MSPMPIGQTAAFLFKAIKREARKGEMREGFINSQHKRLATSAREWHKSREADLKEEQSLLQQWASMLDGPAAPVVRNAVDRMREASLASNSTG